MRSIAVLALMTACGEAAMNGHVETPTENVDPLPVTNAREDGWALFASSMLEAARAAEAAVRGNPVDAKWQCADPKKDLRSTDQSELNSFTSIGNPEFIGAMIEGVTLASPRDPRDDAAEETRRGSRLLVSGAVVIFADARVRWLEMRTVSSDYDNGVPWIRLKRLPEEVRGAMTELVTTLSSPSCSVPFLTEADIATIPLSPSRRQSALESLEHEAAELHHVCEAAARASGPWDARMSRFLAVFHVGEQLALLNADLRIEDGKLCLGRVKSHVQ
jgi:hypothetical protein